MRRTLVAAALVVAVSVLSGVMLDRLAGERSAGPVTLHSVSPGALERLGVTLVAVPQPFDCSLPVHVSVCPISRSRAEAAALAAIGFQARVVESVLADVHLPASVSPTGAGLDGPMWVVAADRRQAIPVLCPAPIPPPRPLVPFCVPTRLLAFIDPVSGRLRLLTARP